MEKVIERTESIPKTQKKSMGVLGAKFDFGQKKAGVDQAIDCLRDYNLETFLQHFFHRVYDFGNVLQQGAELHEDSPHVILSNMHRLYQSCQKVLQNSDYALFVGGDHSVSLATVAAVKQERPDSIVIWMDAHGDVNTPDQSITKSFHGMPMAFLLGLVETPRYAGFSEFNGVLDPKDVIYLGVRDLDEAEIYNLNQLGIEAHTTREIQQHGMSALLKKSLKKLDPYGERPIHLSFDLDCLDPKWAPCTGVPVDNGLTLEDMNEMSLILQETRRLMSLDFVELNPQLAQNKSELKQCMRVLYHLMGGLFPYLDKYESHKMNLLN